jgi:hypothetical protein
MQRFHGALNAVALKRLMEFAAKVHWRMEATFKFPNVEN